MKLYFLQWFVTLVLISLLFIFVSMSVNRALRGTTILDTKTKEVEEIQYPALTICRKYPFLYKNVSYIFLVNETIGTEEKVEVVKKHSWSRTNLVYFMGDSSFPCLTHSGTDPGRPCAFPHIDPDIGGQESWNCSEGKTFEPTCATRTFPNSSVYTSNGRKFWGFCNSQCEGELAEPGSKFNLAIEDSLWDLGWFDLRTYGSGVCHTFTPPSLTPTSKNHR